MKFAVDHKEQREILWPPEFLLQNRSIPSVVTRSQRAFTLIFTSRGAITKVKQVLCFPSIIYLFVEVFDRGLHPPPKTPGKIILNEVTHQYQKLQFKCYSLHSW